MKKSTWAHLLCCTLCLTLFPVRQSAQESMRIATNLGVDDERDDSEMPCAKDPQDTDQAGGGTQSGNLALQAPGSYLQGAKQLVSASTILNCGKGKMEDVVISSIRIGGANLVEPKVLPMKLGTLNQGDARILNAVFAGTFKPSENYRMQVRGTYRLAAQSHRFTANVTIFVPAPSPGSAALKVVSVKPNETRLGPYPPQAPRFNKEVNGQRWTVPKGPFVAGRHTATNTTIEKAHIGDPPAIEFVVNNGLGINGSTVGEPSGASGGGVVFVTSNWYAAYSTDGGNTFTQLNPTTVFPADAIGFCCDQIVQYLPKIDRFIWLLQGNGMRLASAKPADIISNPQTAWTHWNLGPDVFGEPAGTGYDYPDLAVGDNSLYLSWDAGWPTCPKGCNSGREVVRTSLTEIQAGGTINLGYTTPSDSANAWGSHLSQDTGNELFWAGHDSTSKMRIYSLMEGSNTYFWQDINVGSWSNTGISSSTPDGQDWMSKLGGFPGTAVIGLTRVGDRAWFAWSAGTDSNFRQPHIEIVTLNTSAANPPALSVSQQVQVWNSAYAFGYPALSTNACTKEVGMSFEYGGKNDYENHDYENHVVGFWGDFIAYITTSSDVGTTRFGDYVTIRQAPRTNADPGNLFDAFGYGLDKSASGTKADVHYVLFGRPAQQCK